MMSEMLCFTHIWSHYLYKKQAKIQKKNDGPGRPAFSHGISHTGKNTWQGQKAPVLDANFDPEYKTKFAH